MTYDDTDYEPTYEAADRAMLARWKQEHPEEADKHDIADDQAYIECPRCHGSGEDVRRTVTGWGKDAIDDVRPCSRCKGDGEVLR